MEQSSPKSGPCAPALETWAQRYISLAHLLREATRSLRMKYNFLDDQECEEIATHAAEDAAMTFDEQKGASLGHYYFSILEHQVASYLKKNGDQKCPECEGRGGTRERPCSNFNCEGGWLVRRRVSSIALDDLEAPADASKMAHDIEHPETPPPDPLKPFHASTPHWDAVQECPKRSACLNEIYRVLTRQERRVWWARDYVPRSYLTDKEVSIELGLTHGNLRSLLSRARPKVRMVLKHSSGFS